MSTPSIDEKTSKMARPETKSNSAGNRYRRNFELAVQLLRKGAAKESSRISGDLRQRHPDNPDLFHLCAMGAFHQQDYSGASALLTKAIALSPNNEIYLNDLGLVWMEAGRYAQALNCFQKALTIAPHAANIHYNMGLAFKKAGQEAAAADAFSCALQCQPAYSKAHFSMGNLLLEKRNFQGAEIHFRAAISADPSYLGAYNHLSNCLGALGRIDEARDCLLKAHTIDPTNADTLCNLGNLERQAHRFEKAVEYYRAAIYLKPDFVNAHFNLSLVLLLLEDFENGWPEYEWRLRYFPPGSGYPHRFGLQLWNGESLIGKSILVYDEQGFGDTLMFIRYLPTLRKLADRIVFETRPSFLDLFRQMPFIDEIFLRGSDGRPNIQCDYCIPLLSLPGRLGISKSDLRGDTPYLFADDKQRAHWAHRMRGDGLNVGVVWHGHTQSFNLQNLSLLAKLQGVHWYGLQKEMPPEIQTHQDDDWVIRQLGPDLTDFADTCAVIANLDLVISIDTSVAHLAGAMGKPVWVLLPHVPDWRWFLKQNTTPWYESMRLFREPSRGNWQTPVGRMRRDLDQWIQDRSNITRNLTSNLLQ